MIHSLKHLQIAIILALIGIACAGATASAQTCIIVNGVKVLIDSQAVVVQGCNGGYGFSLTNPIPPAGPLNEILGVTSMQITGTHFSLGTVTITADLSRVPLPSTIISNNPPSRFPATATIRFFATATISTIPGQVFTSATELVFENNNLYQIFPFGNVGFVLQNNVSFGSTTNGFILDAPSNFTLP